MMLQSRITPNNTIIEVKYYFLALLTSLFFSCESELFEPFQIEEAQETQLLEAHPAKIAPSSINSPYWATADYLNVSVVDINKDIINSEDGILNANGMTDGLNDFNEGNSPELVLKAAFDEENLYILASWKDVTNNLSALGWHYNGPIDPNNPGQSNLGWTSQGNDDNLKFEFDNGSNVLDVWKWSLALSEPMGYAIDMNSNNGVEQIDEGDKIFARNAVDPLNHRSGPAFEWSGEQQNVNRELADITILDPAYYLVNKKPFAGDIEQGESTFQSKCASCHGVKGNGQGEYDVAASFTVPGRFNRISAEEFGIRASNSSTHGGSSYWDGLNPTQKENVIARIRGYSGVPGYYLQNPSGSNSDVLAISNIQLAKVETYLDNNEYKVLLIRPLMSNNTDDINFEPDPMVEYNFNVYLTDNDDLNKIGSLNQKLVFRLN